MKNHCTKFLKIGETSFSGHQIRRLITFEIFGRVRNHCTKFFKISETSFSGLQITRFLLTNHCTKFLKIGKTSFSGHQITRLLTFNIFERVRNHCTKFLETSFSGIVHLREIDAKFFGRLTCFKELCTVILHAPSMICKLPCHASLSNFKSFWSVV